MASNAVIGNTGGAGGATPKDRFTIKTSGGDEAWSGSGPYTATRTAVEHGITATNVDELNIICKKSDGGTGFILEIPAEININASGDVVITSNFNYDMWVTIY